MHVTVAICTWNRAELLEPTLERLTQLRVPADVTWELLVVNNSCTDATDSVLARFTDRLPLRRLHESRAGLCHARNAAIAEAQGELLVWTDDDVLVEPDWLEHYVVAAQQWPAMSYFGGTIDPFYSVSPPRWLSENFALVRGAYAVRQLGLGVRPLETDEFPFGANMAQRTDIVREFLFDQAFGLEGDGQVRGDELDVMRRMHAAGHRGLWVGSARVEHYIPPERLTVRYLWGYYQGQGRSEARRGMEPAVLWGGVPRWAVRRYLQQRALSACLRPLRNRAWLEAFRSAAATRGLIAECLDAGRRSSKRETRNSNVNPHRQSTLTAAR